MTLGSQGGQIGGGSGYSLRRAINTTPNAPRSLIDAASRRAMRSPSPTTGTSLPAPHVDELPVTAEPLSQPNFGILDTHSFLVGPGTYNLDDLLCTGANASDMQPFCVDADVEPSLTPEEVPSPDHSLYTNQTNLTQPLIQNPVVAPFKIPVNPLLIQNPFPKLTAEDNALSEKKRLAYLDALGFAAEGQEEFMSGTNEAQRDVDMDVDYDIPAEDENDSQCPLGSDDGDAPDEEDPEEPSAGSGKSRQRPGRISKSNWKKLKSAFIKLDTDIDQLAADTGRTRDNIISLWQNTRSLKRALLSAWNIYEIYFREHRRQERQRVGDPNATCAQCFKTFKETQPNWLELLHTYNNLVKSEKTLTTIQTRNRRFQAHINSLKSLALAASNSAGFETLIVTVGNCLHEDAGLCNVYVSPGAEGFLEDRFRIDSDMYSGLLRNHVCNIIAEQLEASVVAAIEESPEVVSLLPKKVKPRQRAQRTFKEDDGHLSPIKEAHDSDYEFVEEEDKGSRSGSASSAAGFIELKTLIKNGLNKVLDVIDESNLPPGNLMWKTLPSFFIDRGIQITGWPQNVLFPTQKVNPDSVRKSGQGIKDIGTNAARLLAEALINSPCSVKAKRVSKRALQEGTLPIFVEEPTVSGARRFFNGGRCDTAGPRAVKQEGRGSGEVFEVTSGSSLGDICTRSRTRMLTSEPLTCSDSDDVPLQVQKKAAGAKMKREITVVDSDDDDEPVKQKSKAKKAAKGKAKDELATTKVVVNKGKGKQADNGAPAKLVKKSTAATTATAAAPITTTAATPTTTAAAETTAATGTCARKINPRPIKKPLMDTASVDAGAHESEPAVAHERSIPLVPVLSTIRPATQVGGTAPAPIPLNVAPTTTRMAPSVQRDTAAPDATRKAFSVTTKAASVATRKAPLVPLLEAAPDATRKAPSVPPEAVPNTTRKVPPAVPAISKRAPTPQAPPENTRASTTLDALVPPVSHRPETPVAPRFDSPSPPKRTAEEVTEPTTHKRFRASSSPSPAEGAPRNPSGHRDGSSRYPSAWDSQYGYNHNHYAAPPFAGYYPGYPPPPNWGRPPGYPTADYERRPRNDDYPTADYHERRPRSDDKYSPHPMSAYHHGGPPSFFPPPHDYSRGHTPSEYREHHARSRTPSDHREHRAGDHKKET